MVLPLKHLCIPEHSKCIFPNLVTPHHQSDYLFLRASIFVVKKCSTCFNRLDLPNYESKSELEQKINFAIATTTGFGIE